MSVISCGERPASRGGSESAEDREFERVWCVVTDSPLDGAMTVLSYPNLPQLFDHYDTGREVNLDARVINRDPKQIGPKQWEVTVKYSTKTDKNKEDEQPEKNANSQKPEDWPIKATCEFESFQEPIMGDWGGPEAAAQYVGATDPPFTRGVCNSAGETLDPPPMKDSAFPVVSITTYVSTFDPTDIFRYVNSLNADAFWGAQQRQWKVQGISAGERQTKTLQSGIDVSYIPVTVRLGFKRETWDVKVLDRGSFYRDNNGLKVAFITKQGQPYVGLLDGTGKALADDVQPEYLTFQPYPVANIGASLGLPAAYP